MNRLLIALLLVAPVTLFAESNGTVEAAPAPVAGSAPATAPAGTAPTTARAADTQQPGAGGAQQPAGGSKSPFGDMSFLLIMAVPLALMWFMATRSQKKEEKRKQELLSAIKRGDAVVTIGGAHGEVVTVGEATVEVRLGKGDDAAVVTFDKKAVATIAGAETGKAK